MMYTFQENVTIDIPEGFLELDEITKHKFFGKEHNFDVAFGDKETNRTIGLLLNDTELIQQNVSERIQQYQKFYERMVPGFTMGELAEKKGALHNIAIMTFKSNTPLHDNFNILAIANLNDKELIITCSCLFEDAIHNMGLFMSMINNLHF